MKSVRILAFRGIGTRHPMIEGLPGLLQVGHVGVQFERAGTIYGFHPTAQAVVQIGGVTAAIAHLRARGTLMGTVQDDTPIFVKAHHLSSTLARLTVWQLTYEVGDADYAAMFTRILTWYRQHKPFLYGFFGAERASDNCATFLHRLGALPLPYGANQLELYVRELRLRAIPWEGMVSS